MNITIIRDFHLIVRPKVKTISEVVFGESEWLSFWILNVWLFWILIVGLLVVQLQLLEVNGHWNSQYQSEMQVMPMATLHKMFYTLKVSDPIRMSDLEHKAGISIDAKLVDVARAGVVNT